MDSVAPPPPPTDLGHATHTKAARQRGLNGEMPRPIKVVFLGAGSGFCQKISRDIMAIPGNAGGEIAMVDIDAERLQRMKLLVEKMREALPGGERWAISAATDRLEALPGTDYVVNSIEVSGTACVEFDNDIPLKYGIDQCIGDTIGPGGLMKALRTGPVWLDILRDVERLCPQAIVLNYTNPMNMLCLAAFRAVPTVPVVGLCHSVQGTSELLSRWAGVPIEEMEWECAGINHLAWFTKLRHRSEDLYPRLFEKFRPEVAGEFAARDSDEARERDQDLVRKDMALHFGAFITESSGHLSEYLPYYRKRDQLKNHYTRERYDGGSRFYASNWPTWRKGADEEREAMIRGETEIDYDRSWEYGSWIIEAREKDTPTRIHGNVYNQNGHGGGSLITNLPADSCVEVATMIDRTGLNPTRYGALPPQMAHICASNMAMFDLGATAIIEKSVEAAIHAMMLDPLTAAVCSPREIKEMTLELFGAESDFLPGFAF
ncbi:MAG: alpha-glucosidase/alpha-galactosidase [Opitutales bacterium]